MYRGFPKRLQHGIPSWVEDGALFHIRIGLERGINQRPLTAPDLAPVILESVRTYQSKDFWFITLLLLMPDHLHALLSFSRDRSMSGVIRNWKRFHKREQRIIWQENFFDHRLRDDECGEQLSIKMDYIRRNPVVAGLCATSDEWPWKIDPFE